MEELREKAKALIDPTAAKKAEEEAKRARELATPINSNVRSAAAERFARGLVQKEAAGQMMINDAAKRWKGSILAVKKTAYADTEKIDPLIQVLQLGSGTAKVAAAGALANLALGKDENKLYIAAQDVITNFLELYKESEAGQHPSLVALANIAGDDMVKDLLVYEGAVETLKDSLTSNSPAESKGAAVILAVNLASRDDGREALVTHGVHKLLIQAMKSEAPEVKSNAAAAVANIAFFKDNCDPMIKAGVIPVLVSVLQEGTDSAKSNVCLALSILSATSVENAVLLEEAGAVVPLVEHLKTTSGNVQLSACQAIANMACAKQVKVALTEAGVIEPLVSILCNGSAPAQRSAAAGLANLANAGNEEKIAELGAIPVLVGLLTSQPASRVTAAKALANLASVDVIRTQITEAGAILPLMNILNAEQWDGVAACALALARLSLDAPTKKKIIEMKGLDILSKRLKSAPPEAQASLASALQNLAI
ncbi:hypothetical protein CYMTET_42290 [Cymbomonas tetramitiformis]|uniref:Uncharacterized protein n=1 Tax=Cymbomonas tetramitiformis TaxID=36881 RepID=A0AAE0F155_9CHLO|nr:hypothetical protein CYMTET_42290 [Cymbomonas tetramitiformis]